MSAGTTHASLTTQIIYELACENKPLDSRSRLKPIVKVARKLKRHLDNILTYFRHGITNAMSEGFNS